MFLPQRLDNDYRGSKIALWIFGLLVFMRLAMSVNSMFNGYTVATSADGIPLDTYPPAAARAFVSLFAILGLAIFTICVINIVVLIRYRSAVPLMFVLLLLEHLGRRVISYFLPIARTGTPPGFYINLALIALIVVGLALSLWRRGG